MATKTYFKLSPSQSGRSMVEMIGVLAITGVLSIGGIMGYSYAMDKYRANKTINDLNIILINHLNELQSLSDSSITNIEQVDRGITFKYTDGYVVSEENAKTSMGYEYEVVSYGYTASIILYDVPVSVFEQLEETPLNGISPYCSEEVDGFCTEVLYSMMSDGSTCSGKNVRIWSNGKCRCNETRYYFGPKCDQICTRPNGSLSYTYNPDTMTCHCKIGRTRTFGNQHCLPNCGEHSTEVNGKCICDEGWTGETCTTQVTP